MTEFAELIMGIDVGTSSVKVSLLDARTLASVYGNSVPTGANVACPSHERGDEQDVASIFRALDECLRIPERLTEKVKGIGVCGQMHGIVFWNEQYVNNFWDKTVNTQALVSNLYTWQDARTDHKFLIKLPKPHSHLKAYSGYGCNTIFWLNENQSEILRNYDYCGTIQDLLVSVLCKQGKPIMSTHNAASWGYFNVKSCLWNIDILNGAHFPVHLLPSVVLPGTNAGTLHDKVYGIPKGVIVGVALGDLQCSVIATLKVTSDAVVNISTSAQIAFITKTIEQEHDSVEYFPYFENNYLAVAASLNGGNVLDCFVNSVNGWISDLGLTITKDELWNRLLHISTDSPTTLNVKPLMFGERHNPTTYGSLTNVKNNNLTLAELFTGFCRGLVNNLLKMMPREILLKSGIQRIIGSGSVITKNRIIQKEIENSFELPLLIEMPEDSAFGAALAVFNANSLILSKK